MRADKITKALAKKANDAGVGGSFRHMGKDYIVSACRGEAHSNAYIDNCGACAPLWGILVTREGDCCKIVEYVPGLGAFAR